MSRAISLRPLFVTSLTSLLVLALWVLLSHPALAQASNEVGNFGCSGGRATGTLYNASGGSCPTTLKFNNIFSFLVCNIEHLAANLLGHMFCGLAETAVPAVEAAITLAVIFFGMAFTMGVIPATARDFQLFLVKIAFVWIFATQAEYMIGVGYRFLVEGSREAIGIVLGGLMERTADGANTQATGADIYRLFDGFIGTALEYATANVGVDFDDPAKNPCANAVFAVIASMMIVFPPLFYVAIIIIVGIIFTFVRAVFGYMYALVGLAFLVTLSPLFLSFYLFRQTLPFFNKYVGYLASFTLQMVFVFTFLAVIATVDIRHVTGSLPNIIVPNRTVTETTSLRFPWEYCTVCDFEVVDQNGQPYASDSYRGFIEQGRLQCKTPVKAISPFDTAGPREDAKGTSYYNPTSAQLDTIRNNLIKFTATTLLSLLVLIYVLEALLRSSSSIAQVLAGGMGGYYAPQLGGTASASGRPGIEMPGNRLLDAAERGFDDGFVNAMREGGTFGTPGAVVAGFQQAAARMLFGDEYQSGTVTNRYSGNTGRDPGLVGSFMEFFVNPLR